MVVVGGRNYVEKNLLPHASNHFFFFEEHHWIMIIDRDPNIYIKLLIYFINPLNRSQLLMAI